MLSRYNIKAITCSKAKKVSEKFNLIFELILGKNVFRKLYKNKYVKTNFSLVQLNCICYCSVVT